MDPDTAITTNGTKSQQANVLGTLRVRRESFFPAERRIADTIIDDPHRVVNLPIAELAALSEVSEGSVVRFCQTMGFRGYQALKIAIAVALAQPTQVIHGDLSPDDDASLIAARVFDSNSQAIAETLSVLDPEVLEATVAAVTSARRIDLFAVGTSLPVAFDAYSHLMRIGLPVHLDLDSYMQLMQASSLGPGDVALAISHSGRSPEPIQSLSLARRRGARTIAITGSHPSPLTRLADHVLLTVSNETRYREEAMASRLAQLSLVDAIYVAVALRGASAAVDRIRITSEAIADHRRSVSNVTSARSRSKAR